jgi:hypothetical protein
MKSKSCKAKGRQFQQDTRLAIIANFRINELDIQSTAMGQAGCLDTVKAIQAAQEKRDPHTHNPGPQPVQEGCCGTCGHHKGRKTFHESCPRIDELVFKKGPKSAKVLMEETQRERCEHWISKAERIPNVTWCSTIRNCPSLDWEGGMCTKTGKKLTDQNYCPTQHLIGETEKPAKKSEKRHIKGSTGECNGCRYDNLGPDRIPGSACLHPDFGTTEFLKYPIKGGCYEAFFLKYRIKITKTDDNKDLVDTGNPYFLNIARQGKRDFDLVMTSVPMKDRDELIHSALTTLKGVPSKAAIRENFTLVDETGEFQLSDFFNEEDGAVLKPQPKKKSASKKSKKQEETL